METEVEFKHISLNDIDIDTEIPITIVEDETEAEEIRIDDEDLDVENIIGEEDIALEKIPEIVFVSDDQVPFLTINEGNIIDENKSKEKPFKCSKCSKEYISETYFKRHMEKCSEIQLKSG